MTLPDAGTFAYTLVEHVADHVGDEKADAYLAETVRRVMDLAPAVKDAIVADLLTELMEEVARREDSRHAHATVTLIRNIEQDWSQR